MARSVILARSRSVYLEPHAADSAHGLDRPAVGDLHQEHLPVGRLARPRAALSRAAGTRSSTRTTSAGIHTRSSAAWSPAAACECSTACATSSEVSSTTASRRSGDGRSTWITRWRAARGAKRSSSSEITQSGGPGSRPISAGVMSSSLFSEVYGNLANLCSAPGVV